MTETKAIRTYPYGETVTFLARLRWDGTEHVALLDRDELAAWIETTRELPVAIQGIGNDGQPHPGSLIEVGDGTLRASFPTAPSCALDFDDPR